MSLCFAQNDNVLTDELQKILNQKSNDLIDINILLKSQMPTEHLTHLNVKSDSKEVRREIVINELKKFSQQQQESVMSVINAEAKNGNVTDINAHWLVNSINCKASRDVVYQLASHPDIKVMGLNKEDVVTEGYDEKDAAPTRGTIASHVTHIQAEKVWDLGYTGKGVTVAVLDSGCNLDHVDIKDHLWTGNANGGYNFVNPGQRPMDNKGHGSHCAGIVCGDGTSGVSTGIAPDATLMVLKVNDTGGTEFDVMVDAIEYAVENGADIISISIGWWAPEASRKETFRSLFENALQANVVVAAAAGNNRESLATYPAPNNINSPADCPPPYLHEDQTLTGGVSAVISVGGVDEENNIIGVSSQGPVTWQNTTYGDYAYNPGMGLIRPDIVAQGASVKSLAHNSNTDHAIKGGTSMAAPAVAGVMALMLEKNPDLTPAELCRIIEETATPLSQTKSNDFGSGCINALAAVQAVSFDVQGAYLNKYNYTRNFNTGTNQNLELTLVNNGAAATSGATTVTLTSNDSNVTVANGSATISNTIAVNGTATCNFTINVSNLSPDNHVAKLTVTTSGGSNNSFEIEINISNELVAPSNITTQVQNLRDINLSWEATNNATSYNVYRDGNYIANTASTSYSDAGLEYGTLYTYTITSKRNELESESSREIRVLTGDNPEAPSPTNVTVANNNTVSWTNSTDSKSSNVYRKESSSEEVPLASKIDGNSYTDNDWNSLPNGIYQYGVSNNHASEENIYKQDFTDLNLTTSTSTYEAMNAFWYQYKEGDGNNYNWSIATNSTTTANNNTTTFDAYMGNAAFIKPLVNKPEYLTYLVSRQMNYTQYAGSNVKLSFYYITPAWGTDVNTLKVMVSTSSYTGTWTEIWSSDKTDVSEWTKAEVNLSDYIDQTFYIAFVNVAGSGYCTGLDEVSINVEGSKESRIEWSGNIYKGVNVFAQDGDMNNGDNWATNSTPSASDNVIIDANAVINGEVTVNSLTINEGKSLTLNRGAKLIVNNEFNNNDPTALIINDGAQVVHNSENLPATFNMDIVGPKNWSSDNKTGWQFIASPVKGAKINDFIPESSDYDLYKYDGSADFEWINYKDESNYGSDDEPEDPETPVTPTAPAAPEVTAEAVSSSSIKLSWDAVAGATSYKVYSVGEVLTETTGTNYTVSYLQSNTSYCFSVSALNENGESAQTEACATTKMPAPATPQNLTAEAIDAYTIKLTWDAANNATSYNIYEGSSQIATNVTETTYTVENLEESTEYCFSVTSINAIGESAKSTVACATTNGIDEPGSPSTIIDTVTFEPGSTSIVEAPSWNLYNRSYTQTIYTNENLGGKIGTITAIAYKQYTNSGNATNRTIDVYMANTNKNTFSSKTDFVAMTSSDLVYSGKIEFKQNGDWIYITLDKGFEYTGGNLLISVNDKTGSFVNSATQYLAGDVGSNRVLCYYKDATPDYDPSSPSGTSKMMATINNMQFVIESGEQEPTIPAVPVLAAEATGKNSIELSWNSVFSATSYNIYQGSSQIATNITETTFAVENLEEGTEYCFSVSAVNEIGESAKSVEVCATTESTPTGPFTVEIGADENPDYSGNYYLPVYDYARYAISQQIYTKDEIGYDGATINSVSFKIGSGSAATRQYEVYLKNTDQSTFNNSNYIAMAASDKVFDGSVEVGTAETWYTINFTTPFTYTGNNIVICVYDKTGTGHTSGYHQFYKYSATGRSLYSQGSSAYNVTSLSTGSSRTYVNQIQLGMSPKPQSITLEIGADENPDYSGNYYLPVYDYARYAISQQIYTKDEIGYDGATINSVSFKIGSGSAATRQYEVYLKNTDQSTFNNSNYIAMAASDKVFDGSVEVGTAETWYTINFTTPFTYTGNNIVICVYDKTGTGHTSGYHQFYKYSATGRSLYSQGSSAYNVTSLSTGSSRTYVNQIQLGMSVSAGVAKSNFSNNHGATQNTIALKDGFKSPVTNSPSRGVFESAFQQGVGYMASYENENTAVFKGNLNHEKSYVFPVSYNSEKDLANFHLLGNPFSFNMKWSNVTATNLASGYAVVNEEGGYTYLGAADDEIEVGDGFFVKAIGENPSISYNEGRSHREVEDQSINVVITGNAGSDNVVVNLGKADEEGFPKLKNFNEEITTIFVYNNDKSYGIYNCEEEVEEVPIYLNNTNGMGKYTISIDAKGDFENITLVDLVSGDETNMLVHDYNFTASQQENTKRFILKFVEKQQTTDNSNFVYQSGEELIVNTQGTVQIIDVVGRVVYNNVVLNESERINISGFTTGTYIVRVISDKDVMTQKIVVY